MVSLGQLWPAMVGLDQSQSVLVSFGQSWSVLVSHGQSWLVTVSHGQSHSVTVVLRLFQITIDWFRTPISGGMDGWMSGYLQSLVC